MPSRCVIRGCKSGYSGKSSKNNHKSAAVSMHRFPSNPEIRNLWIEFVSLQNKKEYIHRRDNRLCSVHFSPDAFIDGDLKFRSVPTEYFFRHETSDQGWYVKPKVVSKPPLQAAENHDLEPDEIQRVNTNNDGSRSANIDHITTCSSSLAPCNMLEEMVDDPDPLQQHVSGSSVAAEDPSGTESSQQLSTSLGEVTSRLGRSGRKRSIESLSVVDFETPQKRAQNLKGLKEEAQDALKKVECSSESASMWERRVAILKNAMKGLREEIDKDVQKIIEQLLSSSNITEEKNQSLSSLAIPSSTILQDGNTSNPASLNDPISSPAKPANSKQSSSPHHSLSTLFADTSPKEAEEENLAESTDLYQPGSANSSVTPGTRSCTLFPRSGFLGNYQPVLKEPNQAVKEEQEPSSSHYPSISDVVRGRRTIDLGSTLEKFEKIAQHPVECATGRMIAISEDINSLQSIIRFICYKCGKEAELETELF